MYQSWKSRAAACAIAAAMLVPTVAFATAAGAAKGGNSANAKACQKGGWQDWVRADQTPFANQDECVSYGAQGGTLTVPDPNTHVTVNVTNGTLFDISIQYLTSSWGGNGCSWASTCSAVVPNGAQLWVFLSERPFVTFTYTCPGEGPQSSTYDQGDDAQQGECGHGNAAPGGNYDITVTITG